MSKQSRKRFMEVFSMIIFLVVGVGLPILLTYERVNYIDIDNDKDFKKYKFEGNGSESFPYVIQDLTISREKKRAISIKNTYSFLIIRNNTLSYNPFNGIYLESVAEGTVLIVNNSIIGHSRAGVEIISCSNVTLQNNFLSENRIGISLENSNNSIIFKNRIFAQPSAGPTSFLTVGIELINSDNVEIRENTIVTTSRGVKIEIGIQNIVEDNVFKSVDLVGLELISCFGGIFVNNTFKEKSRYGISLRHSNMNQFTTNIIYVGLYGIYMYNSTRNIFDYNSIYENEMGVYLVSNSQENIMVYNSFLNNSEEGLKIESSTGNRIHHNNFVNNYLTGLSQAFDGGNSNYWYDITNLIGNYWSGWNISLPYAISGSANSTDPYPQNTEF